MVFQRYSIQPDRRRYGPVCPACGRHGVVGTEHAPTPMPGYSGEPCNEVPRPFPTEAAKKK